MKISLHPKRHTLKIVFTNGDELTTKSTLSTGKLKLEADVNTHPAWGPHSLAS
ncbi:MAG: 50S ribosomal protein L31 [Candidatus Hodgkinia cicadicola]